MKVGTFDLEGNGLLDELTTIWCAVVKDHTDGTIHEFEPSLLDCLTDFLSTFDVLIGHNCIAYDFPALRKIYGWEFKGKKVDTLIMSRLQRPNRTVPKGCPSKAPHSVEAWGWRLGHKKVEHEEWDKFSPEMLERCKTDVEIQYEIYNALLEEGKGEGWMNAHRLNMQLFHYLQLQEEYGWPVDEEHMDHCLYTLDRWIDRIDRALIPNLPLVVDKLEQRKGYEFTYLSKPFKKNGDLSQSAYAYCDKSGLVSEYIGGPFSRVSIRHINLDSNAEVKDFLLAQGWKPAKWNTNNKGEKTSPNLNKDDPFEGIQGSLGRLVAKRIQCRHRKSTLEGWKNVIRPDGRISPQVAGIATTGRLKHKTIVNVPNPDSGAFFAKQMRQCFTHRPGWVMVGCDSAGNQMRQLVARMNKYEVPDEDFEYAILHGDKVDGTDMHTLNMKRAGVAHRSLAKNFFYGCILFGAGDAKTAKILGTTKELAKKKKEEYFEEMPGLKRVLECLSDEWRGSASQTYNPRWGKMELRNGYIRGLDGRPFLVEFEKDLLAYALQSDEAIQMAVAYVMVHKWAEKRGWKRHEDWGMLIWMHDEFQAECKPEIANELGQLMADAIKWAGEFLEIQCPHDGDYSIGSNWYETH